MKFYSRIAVLISILAVVGLFVGCSIVDPDDKDKTKPMTDVDAVADAVTKLTYSNITFESGEASDDVENDFTLPLTGENGTTITWDETNDTGNNVSINNSTGVVTITRPVGTDAEITLIATITKGSESDSKEFIVTITGVNWSQLGVNPFSTGLYSGTATFVDTNGDIYVYGSISPSNYEPGLFKYDGSVWTQVGSTNVFDWTYFAVYPSIAKYGSNIYISGQMNSEQKVFVKYFNGTAWSTFGGVVAAASSINIAKESSMALDNNGVPYVAYVNSDSQVKCVKWGGTNWVEVVGTVTENVVTQGVRLAFDSANNPYIFFAGASGNYYLNMFKCDGDSWDNIAGTEVTNVWNNPSVVFVGNVLYVAYRNTSSKLQVKKFESDAWTSVGNADFADGSGEAVLTYNGTEFFVAYIIDAGISVRKLVSGTWELLGTEKCVQSVEYSTWSLSFDVDGDGVPYVSYNVTTAGSTGTRVKTLQ